MPTTKRQHYVPRVYLKAWETQVRTDEEPNKDISGVYVFNGQELIGHGKSKEKTLWKPRLYTVGFDYCYMADRCPKIYSDFVDQIYNIMREKRDPPVYGKLGHSVIKTKSSIRKHILEVDQWDFFYDDGNAAKKKAIINDIHAINSYVIEDGLDSCFESQWSHLLNSFIEEMQSDESGIEGRSERIIKTETAQGVLAFFFMMLCRNPQFNGTGIYEWVRELLTSAFGAQDNSKDSVDSFIDGLWYTELYRMLYKVRGGHFHTFMEIGCKKLQMVLFRANDGAGSFITSDNPAFQYCSIPERQNMNGYIFPLSPQWLLFICNGDLDINIVDMRYADHSTVSYFNRAIFRNRIEMSISNSKSLSRQLN